MFSAYGGASRISQAPGIGLTTEGRNLAVPAPSVRRYVSVRSTIQPSFADRHIGPDADAVATMLDDHRRAGRWTNSPTKALPAGILDALSADGVAPGLDQLPPAATRAASAGRTARAWRTQTPVAVSMIGQGYYDTLTPPVLRRNILENPAWYTAYTPYQPEISQGRLEALLNFQTMVADLTGLEVANASMLDESTAAAEAMTLMHRAVRGPSNRLAVDADVYRQTARDRWPPGPSRSASRSSPPTCAHGLPDGEFFGVITQLPGASGAVVDWTELVAAAHERGALVAVGADLLALTLITPPGEIGADVAFGSTQRFGVPMGFGGPHAGYLAVHTKPRAAAARPAGRRVRGRRRRRRRIGWRCRPASSTSAATRRPATSAPRRCCCAVIAAMYAQLSRLPTGWRDRAPGTPRARTVAAPGCRRRASRWCTAGSSTRCWPACRAAPTAGP